MRPTRIPIFPLDLVLFPGMTLPLHIFEPRYKVMVARCLGEHLEFGMVFAENKKVASIGCTTEIVRKIKDYPDGRMDIVTEGRIVFRLVEVLENEEYYEGVVEYRPEILSAQDPKIEAQLLELFQQYRTLVSSVPWVAPGRNVPPDRLVESLAYSLAAGLPLELRERQALLEMSSEDVRREFLLRWIRDSLPALIERQRMRRRGGGNGHSLN
jgi:Lon protease-like protein